MKKIINGKRYNTETATKIAQYHNGLGASDFNYLYEQLYRTPKGAWFIVADGGPNIKYSRIDGNGRAGDNDVFLVLSKDEVYDWLELRGETQVLEDYFGDRIENA